jgi:hypothetical protein
MPDRLPPIDAEPRARRRAPPHVRASRAEALALVDRAAAIPDGLALLERAPLECIAVLLGVEPRAVERVRAALEDAALREEAALRFARAQGKRPAPAAAPPVPAPPRDPEALLRAARARPGGLALLLEAAPEAAAVLFGVHPDVVERAREAAARAAPAT